MYQIFTLSFLLVFGLFSTESQSKTLNLSPNESKLMTNSSLWTLNATCTFQNINEHKGKVKITVMKNSGSINGKNLSAGQATSVTVKNNSSVSVSAESGTQINLMNLSSDPIQAVCLI